MNCKMISKYIKSTFKGLEIRKNIFKNIIHFSEGALLAKTLVPTKVGLETNNGKPKSGVKRTHRFLKNKFFSIDLTNDMYTWQIKNMFKKETLIKLAVDWTVIKDRFCFLSVSWIHDQGRSVPLFFSGYTKKEIAEWDSQGAIEKRAIEAVVSALPNNVAIEIVADRGFDSPDLLHFLNDLGVTYIIRSKMERYIHYNNGNQMLLDHDSVRKGGKKKFENVMYTMNDPVKLNVYIKWTKDQDDPWIILSNKKYKIDDVMNLYSDRWQIEDMFKSLKNHDVGFNVKAVKLKSIDRWLRLFFLATIIFQFLFFLGKETRKIDKIEQRYSMSSKTPKGQKYIYSVYTLAMKIIHDRVLKVRYRNRTFEFKESSDMCWIALC